MQNTIAIICDCDGTLADDTTEFLLEENGIDVKVFWKNLDENFIQKGWDPPQAYLTEILNRMKTGEIKQNTPQKIQDLAKKIKPYKGVDTFLTELKQWISNDSECISAGINLEGYIISAGIEDLVSGCSFASQFTDIFAGNYHVNPETNQYDSIKSTVTFTEKTKFLYAINKGINGKDLRKVPYLVNDIKEKENRRIPFENMIYIGDGPSDIPCFSAVRSNGGHCIGIMDKHEPHRSYELARGQRTNYGIYSNNYTEGSDLRLMLKSILEEVKRKIIN
jgi:2-hydroxy-3-keto-5-methylthiopentenyl-1-phosphate phosphatase